MAKEWPPARIFSQLRWALRQRGVLGTVLAAKRRLRRGRQSLVHTVHPFDTLYGVDTSGLIGSRALASGHPHDLFSTAYFGVPPSLFKAAVTRWTASIEDHDLSRYTFIDIGCGKGRALLIAATLGFHEAIGIELNSELAAIASRNLEVRRNAGDTVCPTRVCQGDAVEVIMPEGPVLLYMYNPFQAPVLRQLLRHVAHERQGSPAALDVLYLHPAEESVFEEFRQFRQVWTDSVAAGADEELDEIFNKPEDRCNLYRLEAAIYSGVHS